jgi:hypothetical protein
MNVADLLAEFSDRAVKLRIEEEPQGQYRIRFSPADIERELIMALKELKTDVIETMLAVYGGELPDEIDCCPPADI